MNLPQSFTTPNRDILGHAWSYYAGNFAHTATKDYVLAVSQTALLNLSWRNFVPDASDVDQMVRIIDTFLPLCHGFLGKVFVQIPWLDIVQEQRPSENLVQAVLRLIVKLAAEPQVRQVRVGQKHDHLLRKCTRVQVQDARSYSSVDYMV